MRIQPGTLYLIPSPLGETDSERIFPPYNYEIIKQLTHYVVEEPRTARRFISGLKLGIAIDQLEITQLGKHTSPEEFDGLAAPLKQGISMGLISEAGYPAVADPGAELVKRAHSIGARVVPLVGPSSLLMALAASGLNGQSFAFNGYLPIKDGRADAIRRLELHSRKQNQTQIFIETPFRNQALLAELASVLNPQTMLCVAADITLPSESIVCRPAGEWKKNTPDYSKRPAVFLFLAL